MHVLETERLILRHLSPDDDSQFILALLNEPAFIRNIGDRRVRSTDDARVWMEKRPIASYRQNGFGLYAVVLKQSGETIGMCGLIRRDQLPDVDVGFAFLSTHWLKGYAVESASAVVQYGRDVLGLRRIVAIVLPENRGSIRVLEKIGFHRESRVRISEDEPEMELYASRFESEATGVGPHAPAVGVDLPRIDHLVVATPDLARTVDELEERLGVCATPGGSHSGRGTRNALLAIGPRSYLEIVGPDPEQPEPKTPRWFGIDDRSEPRLVTWAAHAVDIEQVVKDATRDGVPFGDVNRGSRARPDGTELRWRFALPSEGDGLVPFLIEWETDAHPASTSAKGLRLVNLRAEHPEPDAIERALAALDLSLRVDRGACAALIATLETPQGRMELR